MIDGSFTEAAPCNANKDAIEAFASNFATQLHYTPGAPLPPIITRLGGRIHYQTLDTLADASILVHGQGNFDIYLPEHTMAARNRFSIAHELGHYVLHFPMTNRQPMKAYRFGSNRVEWEANWFAAGFLMPAETFKRFGASELRTAAGYFGVSMAAAEARAKALGVI